MTNKDKITAEKFNILDKLQKFEADLLKIEDIQEVEFDLSSFYDGINYVVFLTKYKIPVDSENYFAKRKKLIMEVIETAKNNGLKRTGDNIEDYGEHFYFVTQCDKSWSKS